MMVILIATFTVEKQIITDWTVLQLLYTGCGESQMVPVSWLQLKFIGCHFHYVSTYGTYWC